MPPSSPEALANIRKLEVRGRDGPVQKDVLIAWDIENARVPARATIEDVEKAITNAFQYLQRRKRVAFICAVSPGSLEMMTREYGPDQVGYLMQHADVRLAAGGNKSRSTDTKLIQSIEEFISRQSRDNKAAVSVLVLITGDDDYTESVRHAMDAGMDVEVLHPGGSITSRNLLAAIRGRANIWHHDWGEFLDYWLWAHHGIKLPPYPRRQNPRRQSSTEAVAQRQGSTTSSSGTKGGSSVGSDRARAAGDAKRPPVQRISTTLFLGSLPAVQDSNAPTRMLSWVCSWFSDEQRLGSVFFRQLQATASEAGCKLVVPEDLDATGQLSVVCVDVDEPSPLLAVQTTCHTLSRAINEQLALAEKASRPSPPPPPSPSPSPPPRQPCKTPSPPGNSPVTTTCSRASVAQLQELLQDRGVNIAGVVDLQQLIAMANAVLSAEVALGLPNSALRDGSLLTAAASREDVGAGCPGLGKAAARDALARRMSVSQLAAATRARGVTVTPGSEKRSLAEALAEMVLG